MGRFLILFLSACLPGIALSQTWRLIAPMHVARQEPSAVPLPDGRVLVAGGNDGKVSLTSVEIYDPRIDSWTMTGSMFQARHRFPMVTLNDGRIFAAGGMTDLDVGTTDACETYDPKTGIWSSVDGMAYPRENFPMLVLPDGRVFITGGLDATQPLYLSSTELFDPATNSYTPLADAPTAWFGAFSFYDPLHSRVLVLYGNYGGLGGSYPTLLQVYDIAKDKWGVGPSSSVAHANGYNIQLPDGSIVCCGGRTGPYSVTDQIEVLAPPYTTWKTVGALPAPKWHGSVVFSEADSIFVIGGEDHPGQYPPTVLSTTSWFFGNTSQTKVGPNMIVPRDLFVVALSKQPDLENPCKHSEVVYAFGGESAGGTVLSSCEALSLGLKSSATAPASTALLRVAGKACVDTTVTVQINSGACDSLTIDSVLFVGSKRILSQLNQPGIIGIPEGDSTTLKVTLTATSPGTDTGSFKIFCHYRSTRDTLSSTIFFSRTLPPTTLSTTSLSATGTVCQAATGSMMIQNPGCDSAIIDSVKFDGEDGKRFIAAPPKGVGAADSSTLSITLPVDTARVYSTKVHVYYHIGTQRDSLSSSVSYTIGGASALSTRAIINDVTNAHPGDTISVPVRLTIGNNTVAQGYTLHADYDKDLLQMIPPDYTNSMSAGTLFQDINQTSSGADLLVPSGLTINAGTLLTLRFLTFLSDSECTELHIRSLVFSPNDPTFSACVLSTNLDSALICVHATCGDPEFRSLLTGVEPKIDWIESRDRQLQIKYSGNQPARFDLYDVMGRSTAYSARLIASGLSTVDISSLSAGVYFGRIVSGGTVLSRRVVVRK